MAKVKCYRKGIPDGIKRSCGQRMSCTLNFLLAKLLRDGNILSKHIFHIRRGHLGLHVYCISGTYHLSFAKIHAFNDSHFNYRAGILRDG